MVLQYDDLGVNFGNPSARIPRR